MVDIQGVQKNCEALETLPNPEILILIERRVNVKHIQVCKGEFFPMEIHSGALKLIAFFLLLDVTLLFKFKIVKVFFYLASL